MDLGTTTLLGVMTLLALNQVVMRVPGLYRVGLLFWGLVVLEIAVGTGILLRGMPGFEATPAVSWVVGLLFFAHAAQNQAVRARRLRADAAEEVAAERSERARALREALVDEDDQA